MVLFVFFFHTNILWLKRNIKHLKDLTLVKDDTYFEWLQFNGIMENIVNKLYNY